LGGIHKNIETNEEFWELVSQFWSNKNKKHWTEYTKGSEKEIIVICPECGIERNTNPYTISRRTILCEKCSRKQASKKRWNNILLDNSFAYKFINKYSTNDLNTIKLLNEDINLYKIPAMSSTKIVVQCPECGQKRRIKCSNIFNNSLKLSQELLNASIDYLNGNEKFEYVKDVIGNFSFLTNTDLAEDIQNLKHFKMIF
jgi:RNase P subunit RPR2